MATKETHTMDHDMLKQEISHGETATNYQVEHDARPAEEEPKLHLKTFLVLVVSSLLYILVCS
jgi:demethoxyubiquinone hydroxylase (CLK1/Coq7/Cat5 family)